MGNNKKKKSTSNIPKSGGPVVEHPEAPSGISRPTRTKVPSKTLMKKKSMPKEPSMRNIKELDM